MRVMVRNDNYPDYNKALLETLNQQYGYAKDVKKYFDLK
ncbi:serine/threonine protein phosphatase [Streptococcus salivarius]|nr:serine/threonine protein phosphatase [Streptococcus salivarius]